MIFFISFGKTFQALTILYEKELGTTVLFVDIGILQLTEEFCVLWEWLLFVRIKLHNKYSGFSLTVRHCI